MFIHPLKINLVNQNKQFNFDNMKLKIEIDLEDLVSYLGGEEVDLNEEIKTEIISRVVDKIMRQISLNDLQSKLEKEYSEKIEKRAQSISEMTDWSKDNITARAIRKHLIPQIRKDIVERVTDSLKNDSEFLLTILKNIK